MHLVFSLLLKLKKKSNIKHNESWKGCLNRNWRKKWIYLHTHARAFTLQGRKLSGRLFWGDWRSAASCAPISQTAYYISLLSHCSLQSPLWFDSIGANPLGYWAFCWPREVPTEWALNITLGTLTLKSRSDSISLCVANLFLAAQGVYLKIQKNSFQFIISSLFSSFEWK